MILVQGLRAECLLCWLLPPEAVLLEHNLPEAVEHRVLAAPLAVRAGSAEASSLADCKHFFLITNVPFNVFGILSQYVHAHCLDFKSHKLFLEICMCRLGKMTSVRFVCVCISHFWVFECRFLLTIYASTISVMFSFVFWFVVSAWSPHNCLAGKAQCVCVSWIINLSTNTGKENQWDKNAKSFSTFSIFHALFLALGNSCLQIFFQASRQRINMPLCHNCQQESLAIFAGFL